MMQNENNSTFPKWILALGVVLLLFGAIVFLTSNRFDKIDFNTQVKPILNQRCIHCHGGVKQSGGFSLMTREFALRNNESGLPAIVPGEPENSELIRRLTLDDPEERMPYEAPPLPNEEIQVLKQWIKEGALWGKHWSYEPIVEIEVPRIPKIALSSVDATTEEIWQKNEIDHFVLAKMQEKELLPNKLAAKEALLRRVSLDLIGIPAPEDLANQFLNDKNPISYSTLVDSLLALPQFGEKWASMWLDLARYADSKGFERDFSRDIWEYRDWVIRAFNQDLPYDQFLTEQIAGDLLPNVTDDQYIATGFHRNTTTNDEGGTNNEEYRVAAVIDRVNTTWDAILGTTFSCVQCHGHPYDPFFHDDYYEFMAFFNNTRDNDTHMDYPLLRRLSEEELAKLEALNTWVAKVESPERAEAIKTFIKTWQPVIYSIELDSLINASLYDTKYLGFRQNGWARLSQVTLTGKDQLMLKAKTTLPGGRVIVYLNRPKGEEVLSYQLPNTEWKDQFLTIPLNKFSGVHDLYFYYQNPNLKNPDQMGFQIDWLHFTNAFPGEDAPEYATKEEDFWDLMKAKVPTTLVMVENPNDWRRNTYVFDRGNWLVPTEEVQPNLPNIFPPLPEGAPKNRLGLAQWLTSRDNPLTSRTIVNRLWEQLFGYGLVETLEDMGTQGIPPTHPALLDWLSGKLMHDYNWSLKKILRLMVNSATYCQSAEIDSDILELDPYNKFYTRGPRIRLSAEQVRDQALAVSGLLSPKMYGPPVMPYQPEGLWQTPYNNQRWKMEGGEDAYRRAIYTFMKRSTPYPSFETFDVAPRQVCVARRIRTNTPLQALVTLNDRVYVEAAQHFAARMQKLGGSKPKEWIQKGYHLAIGQMINPEKLNTLEKLYQTTLREFETNPDSATEMIGDTQPITDATETAALVVVANAIMNLDEFLTK